MASLADVKRASDVIVATQITSSDSVATDEAPSACWGHALCMISEAEAVMIGGQGDKNMLCKDAVWRLDLLSRKWSPSDTVLTTAKPEARTGHSVGTPWWVGGEGAERNFFTMDAPPKKHQLIVDMYFSKR